MKNNFKKLNSGRKILSMSKGFTLVETLVAIGIFTVSIMGLMSVLAQAISDTNYAKQKIVGAYLAQEGIEYIRNMRDTFVAYDATDSQTGWNSFSSKLTGAACDAANGCYFDSNGLNYSSADQPMKDLTLTACNPSCPPLQYNSSTGTYGYTGDDTGFIRKISVTAISADEIKISSTVTWEQGSGTKNITFSENLFNWME